MAFAATWIEWDIEGHGENPVFARLLDFWRA